MTDLNHLMTHLKFTLSVYFFSHTFVHFHYLTRNRCDSMSQSLITKVTSITEFEDITNTTQHSHYGNRERFFMILFSCHKITCTYLLVSGFWRIRIYIKTSSIRSEVSDRSVSLTTVFKHVIGAAIISVFFWDIRAHMIDFHRLFFIFDTLINIVLMKLWAS